MLHTIGAVVMLFLVANLAKATRNSDDRPKGKGILGPIVVMIVMAILIELLP